MTEENKKKEQEINNQEQEQQEKSSSKKKTNWKKEYEKLKEEYDELNNTYLRLHADFENYRKRMQKEIDDARDYGKVSVIQDMLPILDNLESSLKMKDTNPDFIIKGLDMIYKNFLSTLEQHNCKHYEPEKNEEFNPETHEPLITEEEEGEPGKVLGTLNKGFIYKDRVIRPSKVKVKKEEQ